MKISRSVHPKNPDWSYLIKLHIFLFVMVTCCLCPIHVSYGESEPKTYVIITIDHCETKPGIIYARREEQDCGIKGLIDICDRNGVKPTFFFSPYDYQKVGEEKVREVAQYIVERGCDLQLHTHPHHLYDPNRNQMYQYSLEDQTEIIEHGIEKLFEWTGVRPIGHRAGGYSANMDTLKALEMNGIKIDSSLFYKEERCKIDFGKKTINRLVRAGGIVEVPVSVFSLEEDSGIADVEFEPIRHIRKIDIDWADFDQMKTAMAELRRHSIQTITLFLHFHSLLKGYDDSLEGTGLDSNDMEEFDAILKMIGADPTLHIITLKELYEKITRNEIEFSDNDILPIYKRSISLPQYARKKVGINSGNIRNIVLVTGAGVLVLAAGMVFYYRRRKEQS
jgi:peptidoglycan/xylan/chitin deacetylase (PgdA/CDA1 family)